MNWTSGVSVVLLATVAGCSVEAVCTAGESRPCACASGAMGAQVCASDGQSLGPCVCAVDDAGAPDGGRDGGLSDDAGEPDGGFDAGPFDAGVDVGAMADAPMDGGSLDTSFVDAPSDVPADARDAPDPCAGIDCTRPFCEGIFACIEGVCVAATTPPRCDDGVACTFDRCDRRLDACVSERGPSCDPDAGVGADAGVTPVCEPFDRATDIPGDFFLYPTPSLDCLKDYSIESLNLALDVTGLTVTGAPAVMIGGVPVGASFSATGSTACGTYVLSGRFVCADRFEATLTVSFSGACSICGPRNHPVVGLR